MEDKIYTVRTISECIGAALTLMRTNIKRLATALWIPTLLLATISAVGSPILHGIQQRMATATHTSTDLCCVLAIGITAFVTTLFLYACVFKQINLKSVKHNIKRTSRIFCVVFIATVVFAILFSAIVALFLSLASRGIMAQSMLMALFGVSMLALIAISIIASAPLAFALTKYMAEPDTKMRSLWANYKKGFGRIGFIIGFFLLSAVLMAITYSIVALPGVILSTVATLSAQGVAMGDPANLPSAFPILMGGTQFFSTITATILMVWQIFSVYYMYASIEAKSRLATQE